MPVEFPSSARAERPPTPPEPEPEHEHEHPSEHADGFDAEAAREAFRLRGKAGHDRVLESLKKEATALKETRQYLFGRLLNLQVRVMTLIYFVARVRRARSRVQTRQTQSRGSLVWRLNNRRLTRRVFISRSFLAQLEEAVLRDHLNRGVNEPSGNPHDGA